MSNGLLSLDEYNALPPFQKGYVCYFQACHEGSAIPDKCPYPKGSPEAAQFGDGSFQAMLEVQEME